MSEVMQGQHNLAVPLSYVRVQATRRRLGNRQSMRSPDKAKQERSGGTRRLAACDRDTEILVDGKPNRCQKPDAQGDQYASPFRIEPSLILHALVGLGMQSD